jgi:hypothetical protein
MTEYDYSPEAHQRYMETQSRISNWTRQTSQHASEYENPFKPTDPNLLSRSDFYSKDSKPKRSKSLSGTTRHPPIRSQTMPQRLSHIEPPLPRPLPRPPTGSTTPRPDSHRSSTANVSRSSPSPVRGSPVRSSSVPVPPRHSRTYEYALRGLPPINPHNARDGKKVETRVSIQSYTSVQIPLAFFPIIMSSEIPFLKPQLSLFFFSFLYVTHCFYLFALIVTCLSDPSTSAFTDEEITPPSQTPIRQQQRL